MLHDLPTQRITRCMDLEICILAGHFLETIVRLFEPAVPIPSQFVQCSATVRYRDFFCGRIMKHSALFGTHTGTQLIPRVFQFCAYIREPLSLKGTYPNCLLLATSASNVTMFCLVK